MAETNNDKSPIFKNWNGWYVSLVVFLTVTIVLLSLFTKTFA